MERVLVNPEPKVEGHPVTGKDRLPFGVVAHLNVLNIIADWRSGFLTSLISLRRGFESHIRDFRTKGRCP